MPYMGGFAPEMMPCMSASPQRNDLVTKAKAQPLIEELPFFLFEHLFTSQRP